MPKLRGHRDQLSSYYNSHEDDDDDDDGRGVEMAGGVVVVVVVVLRCAPRGWPHSFLVGMQRTAFILNKQEHDA